MGKIPSGLVLQLQDLVLEEQPIGAGAEGKVRLGPHSLSKGHLDAVMRRVMAGRVQLQHPAGVGWITCSCCPTWRLQRQG